MSKPRRPDRDHYEHHPEPRSDQEIEAETREWFGKVRSLSTEDRENILQNELSLAYGRAVTPGLELKLHDPKCVHHQDAFLIMFATGLTGLLDFGSDGVALFLRRLAKAVDRDDYDVEETPRELFWTIFDKPPKMVVPA